MLDAVLVEGEVAADKESLVEEKGLLGLTVGVAAVTLPQPVAFCRTAKRKTARWSPRQRSRAVLTVPT